MGTAFAFSPDDALLAIGSETGTITLWETGTGVELATMSGHPGVVDAVAISPDGRLLASGGRSDRDIRLWSLDVLKTPGVALAERTRRELGLTVVEAAVVPVTGGADKHMRERVR